MTHDELKHLLEEAATAETAGKYDEAERLANEVLSSTNPAKSSELEHHIKALLVLGNIEDWKEKYQNALEKYTNALTLCDQAADASITAETLLSIGIEYLNLSEFAHALECLERSLQLYEELGNKMGMANVLGNIGNSYSNPEDFGRALECHTRALRLAEELGDKAGIAKHLSNKGIVHVHFLEYTQGLECYNKSLQISTELGNKGGMAGTLHNIGRVYNELADSARALDFYARALALNEERGNKRWMANNLGAIGGIYLDLGEYTKALEYCSRALNLAEELEDKAGIALWLGNVGVALIELAEYTRAMEYLSRALMIDEQLGLQEGVARHLNNIGAVHLGQQDFARALEYFGRSLQLMEDFGQRAWIARIKASMGELHADPMWSERDEAKAEEYLLEAMMVSEELGMKLYNVYKVLSDLYKRQERWKECQAYFEKYHEIEKEVRSGDARKQAQKIEERQKIAEHEKLAALDLARSIARIEGQQQLLYKILPSTVAERLLEGETEVADYFPAVSILFADIVGFTPISAQMPAHVVVKFLNFVFAQFDRIMKEHGCEKIKTIGDGYMAIAGAPLPCDDHAERIAAAALAMQRDIHLPDDIREHIDEGTVFSIRIGIHTGSAVGGIIGDERFVYDVHGDAVNLAARMESSGEPGRIHVSSEFAMHLQNRMNVKTQDVASLHSIAKLVKRGEVEIKGKGMMRTYFLEPAK